MIYLAVRTELNFWKNHAGRLFQVLFAFVFVMLCQLGVAEAGKWKSHIVGEGESLQSIASFYGVPLHHLSSLNQLRNEHRVEKGRTLLIPAILSNLPNRVYEVTVADSISKIAQRYRVSVRALAMANRLHEHPQLFEGQKLIIPLEDGFGNPVFHPQTVKTKIRQGIRTEGGVVHFVQSGQSIFNIASAYRIMASKIARANGLPMNQSFYPERRFFIPGADQAEEAWADVSPHLPVHFVRLRNNRQVTVALLSSTGDVDPISQQVLSELAGPDGYLRPPCMLTNELIGLLQQVAQEFPGRSIVVISGFRPANESRRRGAGRESKHATGMAIDFRIEGVSNWKLFKFISTLPNVGVGYYPRSSFVHLDYREDKVVWIHSSRLWPYPEAVSRMGADDEI